VGRSLSTDPCASSALLFPHVVSFSSRYIDAVLCVQGKAVERHGDVIESFEGIKSRNGDTKALTKALTRELKRQMTQPASAMKPGGPPVESMAAKPDGLPEPDGPPKQLDQLDEQIGKAVEARVKYVDGKDECTLNLSRQFHVADSLTNSMAKSTAQVKKMVKRASSVVPMKTQRSEWYGALAKSKRLAKWYARYEQTSRKMRLKKLSDDGHEEDLFLGATFTRFLIFFMIAILASCIAIIYLPHVSMVQLERQTDCIFKSCQAQNWMPKATELGCEAVRSMPASCQPHASGTRGR
jgi:hypothetical protein